MHADGHWQAASHTRRYPSCLRQKATARAHLAVLTLHLQAPAVFPDAPVSQLDPLVQADHFSRKLSVADLQLWWLHQLTIVLPSLWAWRCDHGHHGSQFFWEAADASLWGEGRTVVMRGFRPGQRTCLQNEVNIM